MHTIRVVVADQSQARFFDVAGTSKVMRSVGTLGDPEARKQEQDLVSDRPGSNVGSGGGHYGLAEKTSHKTMEVESFARLIAEKLEVDSRAGEFDEVALVAGPRFLGMLRNALPPALRKLIKHEVHHDLVHRPESEIRAHLPDRW